MQREWHWGTPYIETLDRQESLRGTVLQGGDEYFVFAEHQPTITLGKRGGTIIDRPENTAVHKINRGGLATWHGPGQLAFYPIIQLSRHGIGVRSLACALETATIDTLYQFNITGHRKNGLPGIWVRDRKIAALGLDTKKGVNIHGVALNISNDVSSFYQIEACGDPSVRYTSMTMESDSTPTSIYKIGIVLEKNFVKALRNQGRNKSIN